MIKNMTRKGLAIGSTFALAVAGLVGAAPAQAATIQAVIPTVGTSTKFVSGETFKLKVLGSFASTDNLRWLISGVDEALTIDTTGSSVTQVEDDIDDTTIAVTPKGVLTGAGANELHLTIPAEKADAVTVRAYVESGDAAGYNPAFDVVASAPVEVTFVKAADVVATIAFDTPLVGDTTASATVSFDVNNEQLANLSGVLTYADTTTLTVTSPTVAAWSATNKFAFTATVDDPNVTSPAGLGANKALKLQMQVGSTPRDLGSASTALVVKPAAASFKLDTVTSANVTPVTSGSADARRNTEYSLSVTARDNSNYSATTAKAVAGANVYVKVTTDAALAATGSAAKSLIIGGTAYTANNKLPGTGDVKRIALTTGTDGKVTWTMSTTGYAAGDTVTVEVQVENLAADTLVIESVDPSYSMYVTNGPLQSVTAKGTASVNVSVYDQFGGVPAAGYDVRALLASSSRSGTGNAAATAASNSFAAVSGGLATLSITDNGAGTGSNFYNLELAERVPGGAYAAASDTISNYEIKVVSAVPAAGEITLTDGGAAPDATTKVYARSGTLSQKDNGTYDGRAVVGSAPEHTNYVNLNGNVKTAASPTAASANVPGVPVVLKGAGLQFKTTVDGKDVFAVDQITVYTDGSGNYVASVASHLAGKQAVTIESGAATRTVEITFSAAGSQTGANVVIDAPYTVKPGSTLAVTIKVTDKYGNPVDTSTGAANLVVSYNGGGLLVGTGVGTVATETNADGEIKFNVLLGANDSGNVTVTVRHRLGASNDNTNDVVVQRSVFIGLPGNTGPLNTWTSDKGDGLVKVYAKNIVGAGKVQMFFNGEEIAWVNAADETDPKLRTVRGSAYLVRSVQLVEGMKNVIEIYVDGERTTRSAYTY